MQLHSTNALHWSYNNGAMQLHRRININQSILIYPGEYIPTPSPQPPSNTQTQYQYQPELCTSIGAFIITTYAVALEQ